MSTSTNTEEVVEEKIVDEKILVLFNDDHNTFDHVIDCLIKYCNHSTIQAEQCSWIVHYNGKCDVKHGAFDELKPVCEALLEGGLSAEIY